MMAAAKSMFDKGKIARDLSNNSEQPHRPAVVSEAIRLFLDFREPWGPGALDANLPR